MKQFVTLLAAAVCSFMLTSLYVSPTSETLTISSKASKVEWYANKITGAHNGIIMLKAGEIILENSQLVSGNFEVDMTTILCKDLEQPSSGKLERHLRSEDFFDVESFPTSTFVITKAVPKEVGPYNTEITGNLTIKGITHPITFPAKVKINDGKFAAYGEMNIDRTKYNIQYGSSSFFENLGDRAIDDIFVLKISLGAQK